ncbi:MAG: molybdopterin-dependent oxidoreductase [Caldilineaceae bacterium]|nr:molybdopterin-dependent oxidoreductase [Caldilineaceae bacterium]
MEQLKELPRHDIPAQVQTWSINPTLQIVGLVAEPQTLTPHDLTTTRAALDRSDFTDDFLCDGKWTVPDQQWSGFRLLDVINLAEPLPTAKYIRVGSGDYVVPISLEDAENALLADTLNGQALTVEHGAPWRLALFGGRCFTSVKWVDRLELTAEPGENTSLQIVRERNQALLAQKRAPKP